MVKLEDIEYIPDLPSGPLDEYRKKTSFNWKEMKIILENPSKLKLKVILKILSQCIFDCVDFSVGNMENFGKGPAFSTPGHSTVYGGNEKDFCTTCQTVFEIQFSTKIYGKDAIFHEGDINNIDFYCLLNFIF